MRMEDGERSIFLNREEHDISRITRESRGNHAGITRFGWELLRIENGELRMEN